MGRSSNKFQFRGIPGSIKKIGRAGTGQHLGHFLPTRQSAWTDVQVLDTPLTLPARDLAVRILASPQKTPGLEPMEPRTLSPLDPQPGWGPVYPAGGPMEFWTPAEGPEPPPPPPSTRAQKGYSKPVQAQQGQMKPCPCAIENLFLEKTEMGVTFVESFTIPLHVPSAPSKSSDTRIISLMSYSESSDQTGLEPAGFGDLSDRHFGPPASRPNGQPPISPKLPSQPPKSPSREVS